MDKIYSRKRIKIKQKNAKRIFSIFIILITASITFYSIFKSLNPIFESLALERTREIGISIINESASKILGEIDYKNVVTVENNVLKTDVVVINKIANEIVLEIEKRFKELDKDIINIPIGALTGSKYLSGTGPNINIKIIPVGNIQTQIKNEFESKGINQTVYRTYLEIICKVYVVTPYKTINDEIVNQVLLVETVVVGDVPEAYYNLEGVTKDNMVEIIN